MPKKLAFPYVGFSVNGQFLGMVHGDISEWSKGECLHLLILALLFHLKVVTKEEV